MKTRSIILTMLSAAWIASSVYAETVTVTNTSASGAGSLAEAINIANSDQGVTDIVFDIPQGGKIVTGSAEWLPAITSPVKIDGKNSSGEVILVGSAPNSPGAPVSGLELLPGAENSEITNISTEGFLNAVWIKTHGVSVTNSQFLKAFARAIKVEDARNTLIDNNLFNFNDAISIQISNCTNAKVFNNRFLSGTVIVENSDQVNMGLATRGNLFRNSATGTESAVNFYGSNNTVNVIGNSFIDQPNGAICVSGIDQKNFTISTNGFANNKGWDIYITGADAPTIFDNSINGDTFAMEAGIFLDDVNAPKIAANTLISARISLNNLSGAKIGGTGSDGNLIHGDPQGFSGSAAIIVNNTENSQVVNNKIFGNKSNGIILTCSNNNKIWANEIYDNGRTAIKIVSGNRNFLGRNKTYDQHADALGGINSISLLGDANDGKTAPTITSVVRKDESSVIVKGTGSPKDRIEILKSSKPSSPLSYEAFDELAYSNVDDDSTWAAQVPVFDIPDADLFLTAIATDSLSNSSELSNVKGIVLVEGISGQLEVERGRAYTYSVKEITDCKYDWWVNGDATVNGQGEHSVQIRFHNIPGSVIPVSVGYQDPEKGWVVERIEVTIK